MTESLGRTEGETIHVLLVDDEADFLKISTRCLEMECAFQIETSLSVNEAMKKLKKKRFDAIVSDYQMPGKDGLEFLEELKDKRDKTPFIVFTGKGREEVAIKALNLGADQYINKIGNPETVYGELAHSIRKAVKTIQAEKALVESEQRYRSLARASAVQQINRVFDFTRTYEMLGNEELKYMDVGKSFVEAGSLFPELDAVLVNNCSGLMILADSLFRQLFYNLIDNSLKHGGKINRIKVGYKVEKDRLKLVYEDDGVGISRAEKEKIFKEGYGKDTGFGLYLIREICSVYGWTIKETGKQGKGAQFTIAIPKTGEDGRMGYQLQ